MGKRTRKKYRYSFGHTKFLVVKILEILAQILYICNVICCQHSKLTQHFAFCCNVIYLISTESTILILEHYDYNGGLALKMAKGR